MAVRRWLSILALLSGCAGAPESPAETPSTASAPAPATTDAEELRAFAKLYGYVRFFHPSDAAAAADWDAIAIDGARSVVLAENRDELEAVLVKIFTPLSPSLQLHAVDAPPGPAPKTRPGEVLAWQHEGFGFGEMHSAYFSGRTGRAREATVEGRNWAHLSASFDAKPFIGKRLRARGWARVDRKSRKDRARVWLRVDGKKPASVFFDNMQDRPIVAASWTEGIVEAPSLDATATKVLFGGLAEGKGQVWFDDFTLEVAEPGSDAWTTVDVKNPGFEAGELEGWKASGDAFDIGVAEGGRDGGHALRIEAKSASVEAALFEERPRVGETFDRELGAGLACRVVVGLPLTAGGKAKPMPLRDLPGPEDPAVRAAAVIVAWNVLRHFYPYHDVIDQDWDAVLDETIDDVLDDDGPEQLGLTLRRLVHKLVDGHGAVSGPGMDAGGLPLRMARVDEKVVVLAAPKQSGLARGDELVAIDGVAIASLVEALTPLTSGAPQWIEHKLLAWGRVTEGPLGSKARVEARRDGEPVTVELERGKQQAPPEFDRPYIDKLADGTFYIDLDRAPSAEIVAKIDAIAKAPGVVFDLRGYPKDDYAYLRHLLKKRDDAKWMHVPHVIYPDFDDVPAWTDYGWNLQPAEPHIEGKVAFITGPGAISYAESVMGIVEGYELGAIVGAPTAGANGNVNPFAIPGSYTITFTGMKVTRLDGRRHHVLGVQPTHPHGRTLAGIRAGKDELLDAALALVRE
jgi:hypothetical protein